jgi:hypothetical protein
MPAAMGTIDSRQPNSLAQVPAQSSQVGPGPCYFPSLVLGHARSWTANSLDARVRLTAECNRLQQEVALLHEKIRIKDARIARIEPPRRWPANAP